MRTIGMRFLLLAGIAAWAWLPGCAQVPKESVELSTTVGRDIAAARESHRQLAQALFSRMKRDVDRFVDDVYAPYQIRFVLDRQRQRQKNGEAVNLFSVLEAAAQRPGDAQAQKDAVDIMQATVELIQEDIEDYRRQRLAPILKQETAVLDAIDGAYAQMERGNAAVTAHLASVIKVHEAQDQALAAANLQGLRQKVGIGLSDTSDKVAKFVDKTKAVEGSIDAVTAEIRELTKHLDELTKGD